MNEVLRYYCVLVLTFPDMTRQYLNALVTLSHKTQALIIILVVFRD